VEGKPAAESHNASQLMLAGQGGVQGQGAALRREAGSRERERAREKERESETRLTCDASPDTMLRRESYL